MKTVFNIKESPCGLLLLTAVGLLILLAFSPITNIDLKGITMFSVPMPIMVWVIPAFLISFWLLYLVTKRFLYSKAITWIHVLVSVCTIVFIVTILVMGIVSSKAMRENPERIGFVLQILTLVFAGGQLIYVANVLFGFFSRRSN